MTKNNHYIHIITFCLLVFVGLMLLFKIRTVNATDPSYVLTTTPPTRTQIELFVATTKEECDSLTENTCFYNDDDMDEVFGGGTGLRSAIEYANTEGLSNVLINIFGNYLIKENTVLIDYPVVIQGMSNASISTKNPNCENPMLRLQDEVIIKDLEINDGIGICDNLSRDLIVVNSPQDVLIRNTSLSHGKNAIIYQGNIGNLSVIFNNIHDNDQFALVGNNDSNSGKIKVIGNRIIENNGHYAQVDCGKETKSNVDHNYWGLNQLPTDNTVSCLPDDSKRLGAEPKVLNAGIAGDYIDLDTTYSLPVLGTFSAKSNKSGDRLFVIDHDNMLPFQAMMPQNYEFTMCGSFYDVFMDESSTSEEVFMQFSYTNSRCMTAIESQFACGSNDLSKIPLMWHDPKYELTAGFDNVSGKPEGKGNFDGQTVNCNTSKQIIEAIINRNFLNRPNLVDDLIYTPFTIGFDKAVTISFETSDVKSSSITLNWTTFSEANTDHFILYRVKDSGSDFEPLPNKFLSKGDENSGNSYSHTDSGLEPNTNYSYKLVIFNPDNSIQQEIGPINAKTLEIDKTPTNTLSPSNTPYPISYTPTQTSFVYRDTPTNTPGSIKTSTPLPELTQIAQNQTMTAFFITQTLRYSSKAADDVSDIKDTTLSPDTNDATLIPQPIYPKDDTVSPSSTLPNPTEQVINTDKTDRYREKYSINWGFWLIFILFGVLAAVLYSRNKIIS